MGALVLTRRPNEHIVIGDGPDRITVTVAAVQNGRVRLAITAPPAVKIVRKELLAEPPDDGPTAT